MERFYQHILVKYCYIYYLTLFIINKNIYQYIFRNVSKLAALYKLYFVVSDIQQEHYIYIKTPTLTGSSYHVMIYSSITIVI